MTYEVQASATDAALAKAIEHGYVEPVPLSRDERVAALVSQVEQCMQRNAPFTKPMFAEMKDLLGVA